MKSSEQRRRARMARDDARMDRREARAARREARRDRYDDEYDVEFDLRMSDDSDYGDTLYRSRCGMICGVCSGVAKYYNFSTFWMRVLFVVALTFTGFWPGVFLYFIAAMVMKVEPVLPLESEEDEEFYHSYSGSRSMALQRLKRTFDNLDRRIQRIENKVTTRDFDWEDRLNS
jgi:phage shock protein C